MTVKITGVRKLDKKLQRLKTKSRKKIIRAGARAGLGVAAKEMKGDVPPRFKAARKAMGFTLRKEKGNGPKQTVGKVGVGVGKKRAKLQADAAKEQATRSGGGVGISGFNFHWWILGTGERTTKAGKSTGRMKAQLPNFAAMSVSKSRGKISRKVEENVRKGLKREAAKA